MLEVMGKRSFFLGEVGQGAKMKLVINMVRQHGTTTKNHAKVSRLTRPRLHIKMRAGEEHGLGSCLTPESANCRSWAR